ncbi:porin [Inquilinus sp. KBS0705]|nr:porin [Inquilinus sp. KBS0705]
MKKRLLLLSFFVATVFAASAQDSTKTDPPLAISGSVDTYYKYDFSKHSNFPTSFASDQNSVSIGMIDLALKKKVGKAAFVGELSFGPRGQSQSIPTAAGTYDETSNSYHIQNLYVSYDVTDQFNLTAGYMATFMGYEVISPVGNFNYSTSYLFTNGPFQNPGFKATYAFSSKASLMAGIFNDSWNYYKSINKVNTFGAQLMLAPVTGWTAYINLLSGKLSGTEIDLTTTYQITSAFKLGLNAADFSAADAVATGGFTGVALYPQLAVSKDVTLGVRGEYFKTKTGTYATFGPKPGSSVMAYTFTANIKGGPLTFIPEVRFDNNKAITDGFTDSKLAGTKTASQFVLAAVYAF